MLLHQGYAFLVYAHGVDIVVKRHPLHLVEVLAEVSAVGAEPLGQLSERQFRVEIQPVVFHHALHPACKGEVARVGGGLDVGPVVVGFGRHGPQPVAEVYGELPEGYARQVYQRVGGGVPHHRHYHPEKHVGEPRHIQFLEPRYVHVVYVREVGVEIGGVNLGPCVANPYHRGPEQGQEGHVDGGHGVRRHGRIERRQQGEGQCRERHPSGVDPSRRGQLEQQACKGDGAPPVGHLYCVEHARRIGVWQQRRQVFGRGQCPVGADGPEQRLQARALPPGQQLAGVYCEVGRRHAVEECGQAQLWHVLLWKIMKIM